MILREERAMVGILIFPIFLVRWRSADIQASVYISRSCEVIH